MRTTLVTRAARANALVAMVSVYRVRRRSSSPRSLTVRRRGVNSLPAGGVPRIAGKGSATAVVGSGSLALSGSQSFSLALLAILSERLPLEKMVGQLQEQINKGQIVNQVEGTVQVNYALQGEMQIIGRTL